MAYPASSAGAFTAMIGMMLSPTATVLVFFSFLTGMAATVAQQIVPLAASLSRTSARGKTVGTVMSGVPQVSLLAGLSEALLVSISAGVASFIRRDHDIAGYIFHLTHFAYSVVVNAKV